jgi:hypothetical protein
LREAGGVQKTWISGAATKQIIITNTHQQVDDAIIVRRGNVLDSSIMSPSDNSQQADAELSAVVGVQTRRQTRINKQRQSIASTAEIEPATASAADTAPTADTGQNAEVGVKINENEGTNKSTGNINQGDTEMSNQDGGTDVEVTAEESNEEEDMVSTSLKEAVAEAEAIQQEAIAAMEDVSSSSSYSSGTLADKDQLDMLMERIAVIVREENQAWEVKA